MAPAPQHCTQVGSKFEVFSCYSTLITYPFHCISGQIDILVSTDVATMGWNIPGLNCVVILGRSATLWKYHQIGRLFISSKCYDIVNII